jgi:hypothetical protein
VPYNGDLIKINGVVYQIPSSGIAGLSNTASCVVNGVAAQALAANTLYYVYAFNNAGTITADFSTTSHATDSTAGNIGIEVKNGDGTRTLVGMVFTNGSGQLDDNPTKRNVVSWFNRIRRQGRNAFSANRTTTSTSFVELNSEIRIEFVIWSDELAIVSINGPLVSSTGSNYVVTSVGFDGTTPEDLAVSWFASGAADFPCGFTFPKSGLPEGHHFATVLGKTNTGTGQWGDTSSFPITQQLIVG